MWFPPTDKYCEIIANIDEYTAYLRPIFVDVGRGQYLMIDGRGTHGTRSFLDTARYLYTIGATIRTHRKFAGRGDFRVSTLEMIWYGPEETNTKVIDHIPRTKWPWRMMLRVPEFVTPGDLRQAQTAMVKRWKDEGYNNVRLDWHEEGRCAQLILRPKRHEEGEAIKSLNEFIIRKFKVPSGPLHEIYLGKPSSITDGIVTRIIRRPVMDQRELLYNMFSKANVAK